MRIENNVNATYVKDDKGTLTPNKEFSAQVIQNNDGKASIRLANGQIIEASLETDVKVNTGDVLEILVKSTSDGKIELKLLGKAAEETSGFQGADEFKALAMTEGLKSRNVDILELLGKSNLSATKEMAAAVKELQGLFKGAKVEDIIFLISNGIEVNEDNLELLKQSYDNKLLLGNNIKDFKDTVASLIKQKPELEYDIENLAFKHFGESYKNVLQKLMPLADKLNGQLIKDNSENLKALSNMLQDMSNLAISREASAEIKNALVNVNRDVSNVVNFFDKLNQDYVHVLIPIVNSGDSKTAQILIKNREKVKKYTEDEPLTIFFALDTQNMGQVKILMTYVNKSLSLEFGLRDAMTVNNIKEKQDELVEALKELSLHIANIKFEIDSEKKVPLSAELSQNNADIKNTSHFDFKV